MSFETLSLSGLVLLGSYLLLLSVYRVLKNRSQKKTHRLPSDEASTPEYRV